MADKVEATFHGSTEERCGDTGLPVSMCGCKIHLTPMSVLEVESLRRFVAMWPGECDRCNDDFSAGETCAYAEDDVILGPCCIDGD